MYHAVSDSASSQSFSPLAGIALLLAATATFIIVGVTLTAGGAGVIVALAAGELVLAVLPAVAAWQAGLGMAALGLRRPAPVYVLAGILLGCSQWYLNWRANELLPLPERPSETLQTVTEEPTLAAAVAAVCVLPAICEEMMFRGVVTQALATRWKPWAAIVLSAMLFSAYHMSLAQALPTLTLGLVYGTLALRARSVVPTMIAHFVNNAFALVIQRRELPDFNDLVIDNRLMTLVVAAGLTCAGLVLAVRPLPRHARPGVP